LISDADLIFAHISRSPIFDFMIYFFFIFFSSSTFSFSFSFIVKRGHPSDFLLLDGECCAAIPDA